MGKRLNQAAEAENMGKSYEEHGLACTRFILEFVGSKRSKCSESW